MIALNAHRALETYNLLFEQMLPRVVARNDGGQYTMPFDEAASDATMDARQLIRSALRATAAKLVPVDLVWDNMPALVAIIVSGADKLEGDLEAEGLLRECATGLPWLIALGEVASVGNCSDCDTSYYVHAEKKTAWCNCRTFDLAKATV